MLNQVYDELSTKVFQTGGDSMDKEERSTFEKFLGDMKAVCIRLPPYLKVANRRCCPLPQIMSASRPFTLIMDDPVANSYLQNLYAPDPDPNMEIITYVPRSRTMNWVSVTWFLQVTTRTSRTSLRKLLLSHDLAHAACCN